MNKDIKKITGELIDGLEHYKPVAGVQRVSHETFEIRVARRYKLEGVTDLLDTIVPKGFDYKIVSVKSGIHGMVVHVMVRYQDTIEDMVIEALGIDGGHHKQWYLHRIAERLGISHPNDRFEEGIAP